MILVEDPAYDGLYFVGAPSGPFDEEPDGSGLYLAETSDITGISFSWGGVDFTTDGPYYLTAVTGWSSPPDGSAEDVAVAGGHGSVLTPMMRRARTVTIEGFCVGRGVRDQLFRHLENAMAYGFGDGTGASPLAGWVAGKTLTADAQLQRYAPLVERTQWGIGHFPFSIQWRCPDPLRYDQPESETSLLGVPGGGLALPNELPAAFPENPAGGQITVDNTGNAKTAALFTLRGALGLPGLVLNGGTAGQRFVSYGFNLSADDTLTIDTRSGASFLNGAYRAPEPGSSLTRDLELPAGVSTVAATGTPTGAGEPSITVTFRPAYW